jgi:hypothetical protein
MSLLAQLYPLAWRHGRTGVCACDCIRRRQQERLYNAPFKGGKSGSEGGETCSENENDSGNFVCDLYYPYNIEYSVFAVGENALV